MQEKETRQTGRLLFRVWLATVPLIAAVTALSIWLFLVYLPSHPFVKYYDDLSAKLARTLAYHEIYVDGSCELVGGWSKTYLSGGARYDRYKILFRVPESTALSGILSEKWQLVRPEYDPPAHEREFGDICFSHEAGLSSAEKLRVSDPIDGYVYLRVEFTWRVYVDLFDWFGFRPLHSVLRNRAATG